MNKYCFWCNGINDTKNNVCSKCTLFLDKEEISTCTECSRCKDYFRPRNMIKVGEEYICRECFENKGGQV